MKMTCYLCKLGNLKKSCISYVLSFMYKVQTHKVLVNNGNRYKL